MSTLCEKVTSDLAKGVLAMEERKRRVGRVRCPAVGDSILFKGTLYDIIEIFPKDRIVNSVVKDLYRCTCFGCSKVYSYWSSDLNFVGSLCLGNSASPICIWSDGNSLGTSQTQTERK